MNEIGYTVREQDLVAFNDCHVAHSPTVRAAFRRQLWLWPIIFAVLAVWAWTATHAWILVAYFAACGIGWIVLFPRWAARRRRRQLLAMYAEGQNRGMFGRQLLRAEPETLFGASDQGESHIKWQSVERIAETPSHVFIYVGALTAFVIPKEAVSRGDLQIFLAEVREHIRAHERI